MMEGPIKNEENNEENLESQLSPEVLEKVMEKVTDVLRDGASLTVIRNNREKRISNEKYSDEDVVRDDKPSLESVLEFGLLGTDSDILVKNSDVNLAKEWKNRVRNKKRGEVFTNIIGRDTDKSLRNHFSGSGEFGIVFDTSSFDEHEPLNGLIGWRDEVYNSSLKKAKTHTFRAKGLPFEWVEGVDLGKFQKILYKLGLRGESMEFSEYIEKLKNSEEDLIQEGIPANVVGQIIQRTEKSKNYEELMGNPMNDNGFIITRRVAPRNFDGVYLTLSRAKKINEYGLATKDNVDLNEREKVISLRINSAIEAMKQASKNTGKDRYFPIYDVGGNLLWPKQMSYEEVKKFVEERDKEKEVEKENEKGE
jgi:hypothetical protein